MNYEDNQIREVAKEIRLLPFFLSVLEKLIHVYMRVGGKGLIAYIPPKEQQEQNG